MMPSWLGWLLPLLLLGEAAVPLMLLTVMRL